MIVGVDIGGTKIKIGLFDDSFKLVNAKSIYTNPELSGYDLYDYLEKEIIKISGDYKIEGIGLGCPGPINASNVSVSPTYIKAWKNFPLKANLEHRFKIPITIENDAKSFALAEALFGAGVNHNTVLGIVISTGIGAGIVINKQLFHGSTGNAGHIGHAVINYNGEECPKGGRGCVTTVSSGVSIGKRGMLLVGRNNARDISIIAEAGNQIAKQIMSDAASAMAAAVASSVHLLDPEIVVIGGSLALKNDWFWAEMIKHTQTYLCLEFSKNINITRSRLGDTAGITGAAAILKQTLENQYRRSECSKEKRNTLDLIK